MSLGWRMMEIDFCHRKRLGAGAVLGRCSLVVLMLFCLASSCWGGTGSWQEFKKTFISPDGRVVDYKQQEISHSEGQGYAMLLAVLEKDRPIFEQLWRWTQTNLQVRDQDALLCWSWGRRFNGQWTVLDYNNATDGDLCVALALLLAAETWQVESFKTDALAIMASIKDRLIVDRYGLKVVLPGYYGFSRRDSLVVNPSYWVLPAFKYFARYQDKRLWLEVHQDAVQLISRWNFSDLNLPPDWLFLSDKGGGVFADKPQLCGYEGIRVFLFMAWDDQLGQMPGLVALLDRIAELHFVPLPLDLEKNRMSLWGGPAGFYAVMGRCANALGRKEQGQWLWQEAHRRLQREQRDYYSYVLYLLAGQKEMPWS